MSKWEQFLNEVFEEDQARIELLRQWMRLALNSNPNNKPLVLCGPSRTGKSITGRVIAELFGETATRLVGRVPPEFKPKTLVVIDGYIGENIDISHPCNVIMITNLDPEVFSDRFVVLPFKKSFLGKERVDILAELEVELDSIRCWALV